MAAEALFLVAMFASVLLHELAHAVVARGYGIRTLEIIMYPIGGVARLERQAPAKPELFIAAAGPAVNVALGGALVGAGIWMAGGDATLQTMLERIAWGNAWVAGFNLLPAFPMDGGRILRAALSLWKGEEAATRTATRLGRGLAAIMGLYGFVNGQMLVLLVAFLIYMAATQEGAASEGRALTQGIPVTAAMVTDFHTISHGGTLREAADLLLATSQQDFPVVHGDQVVGLLDRVAFVRGMATEGVESYVSSVMERNFVRVPPGMDLAQSMPLLAEAGSCALVMDGEKLVGLLTTENISEFLLLRKLGLPPRSARGPEGHG